MALKKPAWGAAAASGAMLAPKPLQGVAGQAAALQSLGQHHRRRQLAADVAAAVAGEVVAQHHRAALQRAGQPGVVIELGRQRLHGGGKAGLASERTGGQALQLCQGGAGVWLGEHGVEPEQGDLLFFKQRVDQLGHAIARPGPAADFGQAGLVDVDDDNALLQRAGQGGAQPGVVNDVVQPLQHTHGHDAHRMKHGQQQREQRDGDASAVPAQEEHGDSTAGAMAGEGTGKGRAVEPARGGIRTAGTACGCRRAR